jgi:murein L,D-transpeptidase YcbB/YkuD
LEVLREGAKSEDARRCQALLNARARGHGSTVDVVAEDAHYGAKSAGIVKFVQGEEGLTIDGICGPATWTALLGD